jgi:hypothetical protein
MGPEKPTTPTGPNLLSYQPETRAAEARRQRLREAAALKARESHSGTNMFMFLARSAIRFAVDKEPDPRVRSRRRNILLRRWEQYTRELKLLPYVRLTPPPWRSR